jgi:ubiquinone/menaquinone biosynthesis C-methylase UbiE
MKMSSPDLEVVRQYYRKRAADYDAQKARTWQDEKGFADEIIDYIVQSVKEAGRLGLEAGIGTGRIAIPLLERSDVTLVGVDLCPEMLEVARQKSLMLKPEQRPILLEADLHKLPFSEQTLDFILCISVLHYTDAEIVLKEFCRVLRLGGNLILGDLIIHPDDDQGFMQRVEEALSLAHQRYYRPKELQGLVESCGFQMKGLRTISYEKSYRALVEDKARYFNLELHKFYRLLDTIPPHIRKTYQLSEGSMMLHYGLFTAAARAHPAEHRLFDNLLAS